MSKPTSKTMFDCQTQSEEAPQPRNTKPVRVRVKLKSYYWIAELEDLMDVHVDSGDPFDCYLWLLSNEVSGAIAEFVADHFRAIHEEVTHAIKKTNRDCVEGYSIYSNKTLKRMQAFAHTVTQDCERHHTNSLATRKPRKKKVKEASTQISSLQFKKEDPKYKVVSVDPAKVVGASQLWVFNTVSRDLTVYNTMRRDGFYVKGTTLYGWDPETSETRKLRKPEEILPKVLSGGKRILGKLMSTLTTKPSKTNGRINNHCILLKVTK